MLYTLVLLLDLGTTDRKDACVKSKSLLTTRQAKQAKRDKRFRCV